MEATGQLWLLLLVAAVAALLVYWSYGRKSLKNWKPRLPPGPAGWPVLGNLGIFVTNSHPHRELDRLSKQYGPIMSLRLGSKLTIIVSSPKMAEEILKTYDKEFASRPPMRVAEVLGYGEDHIVFCPYNAHWRFMRKIAVSELLNPKRVEQFGAVRADEICSLVKWLESASGTGAPVDVNRGISTTVTNMMTRILMSKRFVSYGDPESSQKLEESSQLLAMIHEAFFLAGVSFVGDVIPWLSFLDRIMNYEGAMRRVHEQYDAFLEGVVEEHRRRMGHGQLGDEQAQKDFLDILLSLPGEDGGQRLLDSTVKGIVMDAFNGGIDTSSITIEWGLSELLRHPEVMHKVQAELDSVVGSDRVVEECDLPNLPYFQAVMKEVFRLRPAAPFLFHFNPQPCRVAGFDIPAGTTTIVNAWAISRSPDAWDRPLQFFPERFLGRDIDVQGKHFQLLPFGSGRRGCPGMNLGVVLVGHTLARLVQSFDWALPQGEALDMSEKFGLSLPRAKPLMAVPTPRLPHHLY